MFDLIGLGAALANIQLASAATGTSAAVRIEDADGQLTDPPAEISRLHSPAEDSLLAAEIERRHTNRRPYSTRPIEPAELAQLAQTALATQEPDGRFQVAWLTDRNHIGRFAKLVARCDRLRFEYPAFHAELFKQLRFRPSEAEQTGDGLDVRTLELPPGGALALRMLKPWPVMRIWKALGGTRLLAFPSRVSVLRSGAVGLVAFRSRDDRATSETSSSPLEAWREDCLIAGAIFQRLWLKASQLGLALQPLGSLPLFFARLNRLDGEGLTPSDQQTVQHLQNQYQNLVPHLSSHTLGMAFRIGNAKPPKYRSRRSAFPG